MKKQVWRDILKVGGAVPREEREMKGHTVKLPPSHFEHHARTLGTGSLSDVILQGVGQFACQFHSLFFAAEPRNSSVSGHFGQMVTGCLHQVIFLLRKFADK